MFTLEEQVKVSNTCFISLGNYCLTSMLLKENNMKNESYPFDWMVSCIENIIDVFDDDFSKLLDKNNYINTSFGTRHKLYYDKTNVLFKDDPKFQKLLTDHQHHHLLTNNDDYNYLLRCINRIRNIFKNYNNVIFIMIQPLYISQKNNDDNLILELYTTLKKYYNNKNFKLLIFNIVKINNNEYKKTKLNEEVYVYELKTNMVIGNYRMMYFDKDGINKFIEILKSFD
jgi:hypothetical protein